MLIRFIVIGFQLVRLRVRRLFEALTISRTMGVCREFLTTRIWPERYTPIYTREIGFHPVGFKQLQFRPNPEISLSRAVWLAKRVRESLGLQTIALKPSTVWHAICKRKTYFISLINRLNLSNGLNGLDSKLWRLCNARVIMRHEFFAARSLEKRLFNRLFNVDSFGTCQ